MAIEDFAGYRTRELRMPDGGKIICFFYVPIDSPKKSSVEDGNHNVFRVDREGRVMWQITRVDHPEVNWELKHQHAREEGLPGRVEPFIAFVLHFPDGTRYPPHDEVDVIDWVPGCRVEMSNLGIGTRWFRLDVDTGVAVEITPRGQRPW